MPVPEQEDRDDAAQSWGYYAYGGWVPYKSDACGRTWCSRGHRTYRAGPCPECVAEERPNAR